MATCDECGEYENLPYQCRRCGKTFCGEHRLPENHDCPGLAEWNDPGGVFESDTNAGGGGGTGRSATGARGSGSGSAGAVGRIKRRIERETSTGGFAGYFRGNATYVLLALMWLTFVAQLVVIAVGGQALHNRLFVLHPDRIEYVWTWVTSVFSHSPELLFHILANSIVLFFFGPLVERAVGSRKFVGLFLVAGIVAGLGNTTVNLLTGVPFGVLGASGATFALLGVLTVWRPNMEILLFFVIPMKIKYLTWGTAIISALFVLDPSLAAAAGLGGIAHLAHLIGFAIGLAFGKRNEGLARSARGGGGAGVRGPRGPRGPGGPGGPGRY
ncbi:rhomboid family intramembrane serine protease [Halorubrum gandharaense]